MKKPNEQIRIMVIEDDRAILGSLVDVLQLEGYQVDTPGIGGEHLQDELQERLPDLIILDVLLSGHDGRRICKNLKSQEQTAHIPVILISAHTWAKATAFEAGADDFLEKPFNVDDLLDAIAGLLAGQAMRNEK